MAVGVGDQPLPGPTRWGRGDQVSLSKCQILLQTRAASSDVRGGTDECPSLPTRLSGPRAPELAEADAPRTRGGGAAPSPREHGPSPEDFQYHLPLEPASSLSSHIHTGGTEGPGTRRLAPGPAPLGRPEQG